MWWCLGFLQWWSLATRCSLNWWPGWRGASPFLTHLPWSIYQPLSCISLWNYLKDRSLIICFSEKCSEMYFLLVKYELSTCIATRPPALTVKALLFTSLVMSHGYCNAHFFSWTMRLKPWLTAMSEQKSMSPGPCGTYVITALLTWLSEHLSSTLPFTDSPSLHLLWFLGYNTLTFLSH